MCDVWTGQYVTYTRAKDTGEIFAWGLNNYFQLGEWHMLPKLVMLSCLYVVLTNVQGFLNSSAHFHTAEHMFDYVNVGNACYVMMCHDLSILQY